MKIKRLTDDTLVARALAWLARAVFRHRGLFFYPQLGLFVLCILVTVKYPGIQFDTRRDNLVGAKKKYHQNFLGFKKEFPTQDDLVVVVESENTEKNRQFVERLGVKLEAETNLFHDVFYKGDLKMLGNKALLFVPEADLRDLKQTLKDYRPFLEQFTRTTNLASLFGMINAQFRTARRERSAETDSLIQALPALERIVAQARDSLRRPGTPPAPGITALFGGGPFAILSGTPFALPGFGSTNVVVRFAPGSAASFSNVVVFTSDGGNSINAVLGVGAEMPSASLTGSPTNGTWPPSVSFTDSSTGTSTNRFWDFGESTTTNAAGAGVTRTYGRVGTNTLAGTGVTAAQLAVSPASLNFGTVAVGSNAVASFNVTNRGGTALTNCTAAISGGQEAEQQMYITFTNGRIFLVTAQAPREALNDAAVERLRVLMEETKREVPGVNADLTGEPVLEHDEMEQSKKDTTLASVVSLVLCALIFIYGYQETGRPVKATLCLLVGLAYTLAFATLTIGHLNILTITFVPILIGLAIDYGVHLISRYEEELRHGKSEEAALTKAMVFTGQGIFTGAFTTAGAFLAMIFTNFKGIQEMGVICGGGLLICFVPMMTLLPILLLRGRQNVLDHELGDPAYQRARIENFWLQRPVWVAAVTLLLCVLAATQVHKVYFDYDLLNMQSEGLPAVEYEKKLIDSTPKSVLYAAVIVSNLPQAIAWEEQITNLPAVSSVESMTRFLTEDQSRKLALVGGIKKEVSGICFAEPDPKPVDLSGLSGTLYSFYGYLGAAAKEVQEDDPALHKQFVSLRQAVEGLRKELLQGGPAQRQTNALKLAEFQRALFADVRDTFQALQTQDNRAPLSVADLPAALRDRFVGVTGKYLLMVYPKEDVWQRANQKEFIRELRTVDRNVTGTPVQLYEYTGLLKDSYQQAAWYSLAAIALLVLFHFRSLACVVLALVPVGIGSLWLAGLMGLRHVPLNPANIMTLPLVIGIGVTNGIHILNRFAEEQTPSILARSTGKAVLVSGLTTIAGFGSLILGKHRGIESLGYVMATGLATCMIAGLTFLPAVLNLLTRRQPERKATQCRQCMIDTGSGGTEVKTSSTRTE